MQKFVCTGRVTREVELVATKSGGNIAKFGIMVRDWRTSKEKNNTLFLDCKIFGQRADKVAEVLNKGDNVALEGRLDMERWEKDGESKSKVSFIVDDYEKCSTGVELAPEPTKTESKPKGKSNKSESDFPAENTQTDNDIPF